MQNIAKQEAIRKAYGDLYELMKENINHTTGSYLVESTHFYDKDNLYKRELFDVKEYSESLLVITPKPIQGIENNNRWIRIESEEDLPSEQGVYYVMYRGWETNDRLIGKEAYYGKDKGWDSFLEVTHYQPIVKPEKPIY